MLSPAQFAELLKLIQMIREDDGPKSEVRRSPRMDHPCMITITMGGKTDGNAGILVQLKDISARGVCLLHNEPMTAGAPFTVRFAAPDGGTVSVCAHVVHSRQIDANRHQIGAEFNPTASSDEPLEIEHMVEDWMQTRPSKIVTAGSWRTL